jgi:hypothetical protein
MAIMFSYNFEGAAGVHNARMQSMFERLGWQNVGGSCYRFPALAEGKVWPEDWFNHVVPALMCFRAYVLHHGLKVPKFSLDAQASTGFDANGPVGLPVRVITPADFAADVNPQFGAKQLAEWLAATESSIPY